MDSHETDYFIIGAGAAAMAFADELVTNSDAKIIMVDRRDKPGGHWNDAYPFVRLHQPSAFYGVNSRELSQPARDASGPNAGLYSLASGAEVLAYFDQIMQQRLLASGRVQFFPMCNVTADDSFESLVTGKRHHVAVRKRVVDSAYWTFEIPSTHKPKFSVAPGVNCIPPNRLPAMASRSENFVVAGPGKTGIDACLWLLGHGVDPARIQWVMPRDAWFLNRAHIQPGDELLSNFLQSLCRQFGALSAATDVTDLFDRLEAAGELLRLDPQVRPTIYRCATVTEAELAQLRRIGNVVRKGYLQAVERDRLVLERGEVALKPNALIIDCSASGISRRPQVPIWDGPRINIQLVRTCQPTFSAAMIGYLETAFADDAQKNALCAPVPNPIVDTDWLRMLAVSTRNRMGWRLHPGIEQWLAGARLNTLFAAMGRVRPDETDKLAELKRFQDASAAGLAKLPELLAGLN